MEFYFIAIAISIFVGILGMVNFIGLNNQSKQIKSINEKLIQIIKDSKEK